MKKIFIPKNVPSSKNSKTWTGKYLVWSKTAQKYKKETEGFWKSNKDKFKDSFDSKEKPVKVEFEFIRGSRHKFDFVNPCQTVLDLMVMYQWIEDDNADIIIPVFKEYKYNKEKPGVNIKVL